MRRPRFRVQTLMVVVLVVALGTGACVHLMRLGQTEAAFLTERLAILGFFLSLILLKLALVATFRRRVDGPDGKPRSNRDFDLFP